MHIDHATIRTAYLEKTKNFLVRVLNLTPGQRPAVIAANIPGYWLYWENAPIVHLIKSSHYHDTPFDSAAEAIDHVAFYMENYDAFKQKLTALLVPFSLMDLPGIGERRIFIRTPAGILLEMVFRT